MNTQSDPSIFELRSEAQNLTYLLRQHLEDKSFIAQEAPDRLLYFVDAHELQSYIAPNNSKRLDGFMLLAEQAHLSRLPSAQFKLDISLKNEHVLHELLFDSRRQTGLLPPHEQEIEEEIAYQHHKKLHDRIIFLDQARDQIQQLLRMAQYTLTPRELRVAERAPERKRRLIDFYRKCAPALMALLSPNPKHEKSRIDALLADSNVAYMDELDWSALGYGQMACQRLNALRRPSDENIDDWTHYLEQRRENSNRSNRIDAEALAYLQELNALLKELSRGGPSVRALFVTRAWTLIKAAQNRGDADFLRHPRLLCLQRSAEAILEGSGSQSEEALIVALQTYASQLDAQRGSSHQSDDEMNEAVDTLVNTWQEFERARFASELRSQVEPETSIADDTAINAAFHQLVRWLRSGEEAERFINDELQKAIQRFGQALFALGQGGMEPVEARVIPLSNPDRARLVPMTPGAPGPIEFFSSGLRPSEPYDSNVAAVLADLKENPAECYIAWATLLACRRRWKLAAIYANSAIEASKLELPSRREARRSRHEAQLLSVQISRLSPPEKDEGRSARDALGLYRESENLLALSTRRNDPRISLERATQILEYRLVAGADFVKSASLASGLEFLRTGLAMAQHDELLQARIIAIAIAYHFATCVHPQLSAELRPEDRELLCGWHSRLQTLLTEQRKRLRPEAISVRARAMELIGYQRLVAGEPPSWQSPQVTREPLRIPVELQVDVFDVRHRIAQSTDAVARLMADELEHYVRRLNRYRPREIVYAPLWASHEDEIVVDLIKDANTKELVRSAYKELHEVTKDFRDLGVRPHQRDALHRLVADFGSIRDSLLAAEGATDAFLYLSMETCYVRLLLTRIAWPDQRNAELRSLAAEYRKIAGQYPLASIPQFRLDIVLSDLQEIVISELREHRDDLTRSALAVEAGSYASEAFLHAQHALALIENDPFLRTPLHWVKSTMRRRIASRFMEQAETKREELKQRVEQIRNECQSRADKNREAPDLGRVAEALENDTTYARLSHECMDHVREAFSYLYEGYPGELESADPLEVRRRTNNIVYCASLILEQEPDSHFLKEREFGREELASMVQSLHAAGIQDVIEPSVVHTIGYAYSVLGDATLASGAAKQLMLLFGEIGADPTRNEGEARLIADALRWFSRDADASLKAGNARSPEMALA